MTGDTTAAGQNALCCNHSAKVFRACFDASENNSFASLGKFFCLGSSKDKLTSSSTRASWKSGSQETTFFFGSGIGFMVKDWCKKLG